MDSPALEIVITHLAGIAGRARLQLRRGVNVLRGVNGSGKTSLGAAIAALVRAGSVEIHDGYDWGSVEVEGGGRRVLRRHGKDEEIGSPVALGLDPGLVATLIMGDGVNHPDRSNPRRVNALAGLYRDQLVASDELLAQMVGDDPEALEQVSPLAGGPLPEVTETVRKCLNKIALAAEKSRDEAEASLNILVEDARKVDEALGGRAKRTKISPSEAREEVEKLRSKLDRTRAAAEQRAALEAQQAEIRERDDKEPDLSAAQQKLAASGGEVEERERKTEEAHRAWREAQAACREALRSGRAAVSDVAAWMDGLEGWLSGLPSSSVPPPTLSAKPAAEAIARLGDLFKNGVWARAQLADATAARDEAAEGLADARRALEVVGEQHRRWARRREILDKPVEGPTPADVQRVEDDLSAAREVEELATRAAEYHALMDRAKERSAELELLDRRAKKLRRLVVDLGSRVADALASAGIPQTTISTGETPAEGPAGRLCAVVDGKPVDVNSSRISEGQRVRWALEVGAHALHDGVLVLAPLNPQGSEPNWWVALDKKAKEELVEVFEGASLTVVVEQATDDEGDLRVEHLPSGEVTMVVFDEGVNHG